MDQSSSTRQLAAAIEAWMVAQIAAQVGIDSQRIEPVQSVFRCGLDSLHAVELTLALGERLARPLPQTLLWDQPSIRAIAQFLSCQTATADLDTIDDLLSRFYVPAAVAFEEVTDRRLDHSKSARLEAECMEQGTGQPAQPFLEQRLTTLNERARHLEAAGIYLFQSVIEGHDGAWVTAHGQRMLMLASYNYLGLLKHPKVTQAAQAAVAEFGTSTHGARLVAGTTSLHQRLEETIARFLGTEAALVFSGGYVTNLATISTLATESDVVICDKLDHASIVDGCLLSRAQFMAFNHNDMIDLERCLQRAGHAGKLVVTEAVYSMDGDVLHLPEVLELCRKYGASLMVDEAHSLGVLGRTGHGIREHFAVDRQGIDVKMGTLSKTISSVGGYIAGSAELVAALRHNAGGFIFTAPLPPPQVAAAQAAFEVIESEPERVANLQRKVKRYISGLRELGFDTLRSETPVVPIICKTEKVVFEMTRVCRVGGLFVAPVVYPAVPIESPRLRTTVTAWHSDDEIDFALGVLGAAGRKCGLL